MPDGLPHPNVTDLLQSRDGGYWVATNGGGVARLRGGAAGGPLFTVLPVGTHAATNRVNRLHEDRDGHIWAGTDSGAFTFDRQAGRFQPVDLGLAPGHRGVVVVDFEDGPGGTVWMGTSDGVFVREEGGRVRNHLIRPGEGYDWVRSVRADAAGRVWVGHMGTGVHLVDAAHGIGLGPGTETRRFATAEGLADPFVHCLYVAGDGRLWAGTARGLSVLEGERWRTLSTTEGIAGPVVSIAEDTGGNLWGATPEGAFKLVRDGFLTFGEADGLGGGGVRSILEDRSGALRVVTNDGTFSGFDGTRFESARPRLPPETGLVWPQQVLQDRQGEWWVPTIDGLFRFPRVARLADLAGMAPREVFGSRRGLPWNSVLQAYETRGGDVWISMDGARDTLARWERATGRIHVFATTEGAPANNKPAAFLEDAAGTLWMGMHDGGLLRYRGGRFRLFTVDDGVPAGQVNQLHQDAKGRLWVATNAGGVGVVEDLAAENPRFGARTMKDGLSSNTVACVAEDARGRIYLGSGRGIDQLDPDSGRVLHYGQADGVRIGAVDVAYRDRHGALWFGGQRGVSRLVPHPEGPRAPPPVFIEGLRVSGVPVPLSELGETEVAGPELPWHRNQVLVDFVGLGFLAGETLRYQFKLEGADRDWSAPAPQRSVNYAGLAPGRYRFLVRAVGRDGTASASPAAVTFSILPPVWRRGWFVGLAVALLAAALYAAHRYRVARLLEVAAMRTRIATDLHDDIGANLTKIAILSEVARQGRDGEPAAEGDPLDSIARISRESVASMSDIVWAINPRRDSLKDLTTRMRRFAEDTFNARGIGFLFKAPDDGADVRLGADVRRQVYLIFKEGVSNVVRHSACTRAEASFRLEGREGVLTIVDDGRGFDPAAADGNGLVSMRRRAEGFGGFLAIDSAPGRGTRLTVRLPLVAAHPTHTRR
jgi:signal transduction histidine kinase/ligand-binding sensor domain-containing protein